MQRHAALKRSNYIACRFRRLIATGLIGDENQRLDVEICIFNLDQTDIHYSGESSDFIDFNSQMAESCLLN